MWKQGLGLWIVTSIHFIQILKGENVTCANNEFTCGNGECILLKWRCDGEADCFDYSDEKNCESYPSCSSNEFQCNTTKTCVQATWRCDGDNDCGDYSDELNCNHPECTDGEYRCANGYCIQESFQCDGEIDCYDSSDENDCGMTVRCKKDQFQCDSRQCIHIDWQCDDEEDCSNGKDEVNCTNCHPQQWKCGSGECIPKRHKCDMDPDCHDRSDEIGCGNVSSICSVESDFHCTTGECINSKLVCNGVLDCTDGTDEHNCSKDKDDCRQDGSGKSDCSITAESNSTNTCLQKQYRCWNDQCIEQDKVCNRVKDCDDGSDEFKCPTWENQTSCGMNRGGCQHLCHNHGTTFKCSCYEGFVKDPVDSKHCKDINECKIFGFCSQICFNGHGSYNCSCLKGYALHSNGRKCKALGSKPLLLLSNEDKIEISTLASPNRMQRLIHGVRNSVDVDYHFERNVVFWTDTVLRTIRSANLNGTMIKDVVKFGLERPCGLAVDWLGMKLFWADSESGRIEVSNFDGAQRKGIYWTPLGRLRAIVLHPSKGYIFWTEWDVHENYCNRSSITRANMDGTEVKRIRYRGICWPSALAVDYATGRIFYVDSKEGLIESSDFDGTKLRPVMRNNLLHPFSISIFEDTLYWTDTTSKTIFKANKFDGRDFRLVKRNVKSPKGIAVFHSSRQQPDSYNCGTNNGGCSNICLPTSSGLSCACSTGFKLLNNTHCSKKIDKFVAYVGDFVVRQISLDTDDMLDVVLPFESVLDVFAMDWDPIEDKMYWADSNNDEVTIRKGKMRPPYQEVVVHKISGTLSGIGVDWLSRKLYWSDEKRNQILVSNLDGSSATVVLWRKKFKPRNLLLHVEERYMYWTSHGNFASINRAGMDGFSHEKIVNDGLVSPTDLTLDKAKNFLYWVDGGDIIHFISLTSRKRNFFRVSHHSKKLYPFSIGVFKDKFFWADSKLKKVFVTKLGQQNDAQVIGKFKSNHVRLAVFEQLEKGESNPCAFNNSGCSSLCLLSPSQRFRCACLAGRLLNADNKTCRKAEVSRFVLVNSNSQLYQVPLSVPYKTSIMIENEGNKNIFAFDVDVKHRSVYFIKKTSEKKEICYVSLSGGSHKCFLSDIFHAPGDIAYDPVRHYIYLTDFLANKIYLVEAEGKFWTVVVWKNLDIPSSITVAYKDGFIFWADLGKQVSISRSNMDGTSQSKIITSGLKMPNSLTIDHVTKHLYWTDYLKQQIELCDFEGKDRRQFASTSTGPTSLALFSRFVYWSEWESNLLKKSGKSHKGLAVTVIKGLKRVTGIQAVNLRKIPVSKSKCGQNNGNCSHFCLKNPVGISCACPVGLQLKDNSKTCYESPRRSIYYSSGKRMRRISLDTDDLTGFPLPNIYVNITSFVVTINHIHWTDGTRIFLTSKSASNKDTKTIFTAATSSIKCLVVDWTSGNLFWTDFFQAKIKVSNSNGSLSADLISDELKSPSDIAIDPLKGLLFWTDLERKIIESSHTDSQSRSLVANKNIHNPVGLTVDIGTEFLYWADLMYQTIERCSYDGQTRLTVVKKDVHAFGLAIIGPHLYWTDRRIRAIFRANKKTGHHQAALEDNLEIPMAIAAISREKMPGNGSCFKNNGNCSSLCLPTPDGRSCASVCDGKLYLKDTCNIREIVVKPTIVKPPISCALGNEKKNCSGGSVIYVSKEKKTAKIAYIVGGVVFVAFIITMSVLVYLCQRRLKTVISQSKQKKMAPFRVSFENRHATNKGDSANDPLVIIASKHLPDQISTTSCPSSGQNKFAVIYRAKNEKEVTEESHCLTISNV